LLSLGALGECVIVGRGAAQLLPAETTLRVRLVGDLRDRIAGASKRLGISLVEAEKWVRKTDAERADFIEAHFLKDPRDLRQYDLVLNTSRWPVVACVDLIARAVQSTAMPEIG
jgi:CMP/dCMP kinase